MNQREFGLSNRLFNGQFHSIELQWKELKRVGLLKVFLWPLQSEHRLIPVLEPHQNKNSSETSFYKVSSELFVEELLEAI